MSKNKNLYWRMKRRWKRSYGEGKPRVICEKCGHTWKPEVRIGGRMPNNWWICPVCGHNEE